MFDELRGLYYTLFLLKPTRQWLYVLAVIVAVVITTNFSYTITEVLLQAKTPVITLYAPARNAETTESTTNIVGKVVPADSSVVINGNKTTVNEQGTFSYQMPLQAGDNRYTITAKYLWKTAEYSHQIALINPNQKDKIALVLQTPQATPVVVLGKMKRTPEEERELKKSMIIEVEEVRKGESTILRGRMKNKTGETIGWIKLTANFKSETGEIVDTQVSFVTNADQYLAPEALMPFILPITKVDYATYELEMEYESMG